MNSSSSMLILDKAFLFLDRHSSERPVNYPSSSPSHPRRAINEFFMPRPVGNPLPRPSPMPPPVACIPNPIPVQPFVFTPAISLHIPISSIRSVDAMLSPLMRHSNDIFELLENDIDDIEKKPVEEKLIADEEPTIEKEVEMKSIVEERVDVKQAVEELNTKNREDERQLDEDKKKEEEQQEMRQVPMTDPPLKEDEVQWIEEKSKVIEMGAEIEKQKNMETEQQENIESSLTEEEEEQSHTDEKQASEPPLIPSTNCEPLPEEESMNEDTDSSLFEAEEVPSPPYHPPASLNIDEEVLLTAQATGHVKGPSGLPLFNLDRVSDQPVHVSSESEGDSSPHSSQAHHVDNSIIISQLSQMDESSDLSEVEVCREGEREVKSAAVSSFLSLLQKNKEIVSNVQAKAKEATIDLQPMQYRREKQSKQMKNPKAFLVDYICHHPVQSTYSFQNSQHIEIHSTYVEYSLE